MISFAPRRAGGTGRRAGLCDSNGGPGQVRTGDLEVLEVAVGLEPTKIGFADRRLDHFGIATLYPNLYPKLYPNRPQNAYLPPILSS